MISSSDTGGSIIGGRRLNDLTADLMALSASPGYQTRQLLLTDTPTRGRLGDYHVINKYETRTSEVYVCLQDLDVVQPPLALKSFRPELMFDPVTRRAFKRECAVWARASVAPGIMPLWGLDEIEGRTFIIMPGVLPGPRGEITLGDLIVRRLPPIEMVVFFAQLIAASLAEAAKAVPGLVHGDLKPSNLLLMWGNVPLISDFGIARAAMHSLRGDALLGTRAYCSPRALDPAAELTVLDDVYSYGVVLEELLTRRAQPGRAKKTRNSLADRTTTRVSADLLVLARQCRAVAPSERPSDFNAIIGRLNHIAPYDQWPVPDQVETIPNPVISPYRIQSVAQTLISLEEFGSAMQFVASTNREKRPWKLWVYQSIAFAGVGKPAHARASCRQARSALGIQEDDAESRLRELDWIMYFFALAHRQDRPRKAAKLLRRLAASSADLEIAEGATYSLAAVYTEIRRFREAEWLLLQLGAKTEDALIWNQLGTIYIRLREFERAVEAFQRAVQLAPLNPLYYNSLGQALQGVPGRAGESLQVLERAIASGDLSRETLAYALIAAYLIDDSQARERLGLLILRHFGNEFSTIDRLAFNSAVRLKNGNMPVFRQARSDKRWERRNSLGAVSANK